MNVKGRIWRLRRWLGLTWHERRVPFWFFWIWDTMYSDPIVALVGRKFTFSFWQGLCAALAIVVGVPLIIGAAIAFDLVTLPVQLVLGYYWSKQAKHAAAVAKALREANEPKPVPGPQQPLPNVRNFRLTSRWMTLGMMAGVGYGLYSNYGTPRTQSRRGLDVTLGATLGAAVGVLGDAVVQASAAARRAQNTKSGPSGRVPRAKYGRKRGLNARNVP